MDFNSLIGEVTKEVDTSREMIEGVIRSTFTAIQVALENNEEVSIPKFGKFKPVLRKSRKALNPKTQEVVKVPAKVVPVFKPYTGLKMAVRTNAPTNRRKSK
jgi:DNA-binding protein HU-beta